MPSQHDLALGFGLTAAAGLATSLGAALVFVPGFKDNIYLGISLAFAAGVMLFVSFVEILVKSQSTFAAHFDRDLDLNNITAADYTSPSAAYHATMGAFFAGVALTWMLDRIIHTLKEYQVPKNAPKSGNQPKPGDQKKTKFAEQSILVTDFEMSDTETQTDGTVDAVISPAEAIYLGARSNSYTDIMEATGETIMANVVVGTDEEKAETLSSKDPTNVETEKSLIRMALITGVAVSLHNFPEGFATFIAAVDDPNVGASIAIAIGIHNIPEGICVAAPIYFATGNKWKAFMWGTLSGVAEPIAGAIGWMILSSRDTDLGDMTYAILFGMVAGMMVFISFSELLPTALVYDPERKYYFISLAAGMVVMAASLMLFQV
eukprot:m.173320 g.173320  ORF g.173320 m.173320 type:complete len:377 (-) comp31723_c1_seq3:412-1542(-)